MNLKPEVIQALEREVRMCKTAIDRLEERSQLLEQEYGWSTELFLQKFNAGETGDEQIFFRWYALGEAMRDWQKTKNSLNELLNNSELVRA